MVNIFSETVLIGYCLTVTHLILDQMTLLPGCVLTQPLALHLAQLLVHSLTGLVGLLYIVSVPDGDILYSTLDTASMVLNQTLGNGVLDLVGCSRHGSNQEYRGDEKLVTHGGRFEGKVRDGDMVVSTMFMCSISRIIIFYGTNMRETR